MKTRLTARWTPLLALTVILVSPLAAQAISLPFVAISPTGNYQFDAAGQSFTGFVENDGTHSWWLVGRGREGWEFDEDGQGTNAQVAQNLGTTAAFAPAAYSSAIINDLITSAGADLTGIEIRIRRAANTTGTAFQEARWRSISQTSWTWDFDSGAGFPVELDIAASALGGAFADIASNTRDGTQSGGSSGNNHERIFTFPWGGHNNQQGFSFGSAVGGVDNDDPSTFLWEFATESHAIPYTEVFIRMINPPAVPEPSTGGLIMLGLARFRRRKIRG